MGSMKHWLAGLVAFGSIGWASSFIAGAPQDGPLVVRDVSGFMMKKLDSSREIVGGLAMENYDAISKAAQDLLLLSHEADWNVITTKPYLQMSSDFRGSVARLRDAGHEKNVDRATLAYFEVTLNCVRCHKYIRDQNGPAVGDGIRDRIRQDVEKFKEQKEAGDQ